MVLTGLGFLYARTGWVSRGQDWTWKWATGAILVALAHLPLWLEADYSAHPAEMALFSPRFGYSKSELLHTMLDNFCTGFQVFFGGIALNPFDNLSLP